MERIIIRDDGYKCLFLQKEDGKENYVIENNMGRIVKTAKHYKTIMKYYTTYVCDYYPYRRCEGCDD